MERHQPPHDPAYETSHSAKKPISWALMLTAVLGAAAALLGVPLATVLSLAPGPFPEPTGRSTGSGAATTASPGPGPGQPGFPLPPVDGGGFPRNHGYLYSTPVASLPQTPTEAIPPLVFAAYQRAAQTLTLRMPRCRLTWPVLAGIGKVESDHGGGGELQPDGTAVVPILGPELNGVHGNPSVHDTDHGALDGDAVWDRAVGPMQILPSVWRQWAATDRAGTAPDPQNVLDATLTAGELLCTAGGDLGTASGLQRAVVAYHHAQSYVEAVLAWTAFYAAEALVPAAPGAVRPPALPPPALPPYAPAAAVSAPATQRTAGRTASPRPLPSAPWPGDGPTQSAHTPNPRHPCPTPLCARPPKDATPGAPHK